MREYLYKGTPIRITANAVETLKEMNNTIFYDRKFVKVLLKDIFNKERLEKLEPLGVDSKQIDFVKEIYNARVGNDVARISRFLSIVQKHRDNARQRTAMKM